MTEIQTIIYNQPVETKISVDNKINAKGESQPEVSISILRKLENKEDIYKIISNDINEALIKVKESLEKLK